MLAIAAAAALTGCSKKAPDVVNDIYSSLQKGNVENLVQYAVPDSVGELTDSEKQLFTTELMGDFSKEMNTILSYEVVKVDVDSAQTRADFEVKTVHQGGTTYTERGSMTRNPETGHWTLRLDSIHTEKPNERTNEAMPRLRAATVVALSAKGVPYYMDENALMMEKNIYATKDPTASFTLYKKAAEAGYARAWYHTGNCYINAYGTDKDSEAAFSAYEKGANAGNTDCMFELSKCYEYGRGTSKDPAKSLEWAEKLYKANPQSTRLAYCLYYGIGTPVDYVKAIQIWKKAAEAGSGAAMFDIAVCYDNGEGVAKDPAEAIKWYKKAIEAGDNDAYCSLGWMYFDGRGVDKDYDEAVRLFRIGADKGDAWAMNGLGVCYRDGKGVSKDVSKAQELFSTSSEKGCPQGKYNLDNIWKYY